jgi:hypothetical protein
MDKQGVPITASGLAHVIYDDHVCVIMGIVNVARMPTIIRVHC